MWPDLLMSSPPQSCDSPTVSCDAAWPAHASSKLASLYPLERGLIFATRTSHNLMTRLQWLHLQNATGSPEVGTSPPSHPTSHPTYAASPAPTHTSTPLPIISHPTIPDVSIPHAHPARPSRTPIPHAHPACPFPNQVTFPTACRGMRYPDPPCTISTFSEQTFDPASIGLPAPGGAGPAARVMLVETSLFHWAPR